MVVPRLGADRTSSRGPLHRLDRGRSAGDLRRPRPGRLLCPGAGRGARELGLDIRVGCHTGGHLQPGRSSYAVQPTPGLTLPVRELGGRNFIWCENVIERTQNSIWVLPENELRTNTLLRENESAFLGSVPMLILKYPGGPVVGSPVSCVTVTDVAAICLPFLKAASV